MWVHHVFPCKVIYHLNQAAIPIMISITNPPLFRYESWWMTFLIHTYAYMLIIDFVANNKNRETAAFNFGNIG